MIFARARFVSRQSAGRTRSVWLARLIAATMLLSLVLCPTVNRVMRVQRIDQPPSHSLGFQRSLNIPPQAPRPARDLRIVPFIVLEVSEARAVMLGRSDDDIPASMAPLATPRSLRAPPTVS